MLPADKPAFFGSAMASDGELEELLARCREWSHSPTAWEARCVEEIGSLPVCDAAKVADDILLDAGLIANRCHENVERYVAADTTGRSEHVLGWLPINDLLIFHSVVRRDGRLYCVTPRTTMTPAVFPFIPDSAIVATRRHSATAYRRNGRSLGAGLRVDARACLRAITSLRELIKRRKRVEDRR